MQNKRKEQYRSVFKWFLLCILMFICFVVSTTGGAGDAKPLLLIPFLITITMFENELVSGCTGAVFGLLIDFASDRVLGLNGAFFLIVGAASSFLFLNLLRKHIFSVIIVTFMISVVHEVLEFLLYYVLFRFKSTKTVFYHITIPTVILTVVFSPLIYFIVRKIFMTLTQTQGVIVEKNVHNFKV